MNASHNSLVEDWLYWVYCQRRTFALYSGESGVKGEVGDVGHFGGGGFAELLHGIVGFVIGEKDCFDNLAFDATVDSRVDSSHSYRHIIPSRHFFNFLYPSDPLHSLNSHYNNRASLESPAMEPSLSRAMIRYLTPFFRSSLSREESIYV